MIIVEVTVVPIVLTVAGKVTDVSSLHAPKALEAINVNDDSNDDSKVVVMIVKMIVMMIVK